MHGKYTATGLAVAAALAGGVLWYSWSRVFGGPPAATPIIGQVSILNPGGTFTSVGANGDGNFEVLPNLFPNAGLRFFLYAPPKTVLSIDLDGQSLPNMPSAGGPSTTGFFRVLNINTDLPPALWEIEIQPPASKMTSTMMVFKVTDVAPSPPYTGTDHISSPATVTLVARKVYSLSVTLSGMGSGQVTSNPSGIACPPTCAFDFGQSTTVTLTPNPSIGSTFDGWSNACLLAGSGGNCQFDSQRHRAKRRCCISSDECWIRLHAANLSATQSASGF